MVEAGIVLVGHFGETEVGAFAGVRRDDVVDHHGVVRGGDAAELEHLLLAAQRRIDIEADAVKVAIHGGRVLAAAQPAGAFHRAVVDALHAKLRQRAPQPLVTQRLQHRGAVGGDDCRRVGGEPHRGNRAGIARARLCVGALPEARLAGVEARALARRV
ncbi:hypothetical protein D3C77_615640 [compost metagenome]